MIKKIVEISTPARLSVRHRQLLVAREGFPDALIPCEDVGLLLVEHPEVVYTHSMLTLLTEMGAAVVICGTNHLPSGLLLPMDGHHLQAERQWAQLAASEPLKKRLWQAVVCAKLRQQQALLRKLGHGENELEHLARRVRSGDPDNLEAQGARKYWPWLFGEDFRRDREGEPPNPILNYGYAVLRAAMARALVAAGLNLTLGIFHHNRRNAFSLADDMMEPYRPLVDHRVKQLRPEERQRSLDQPLKAALLSFLHETVRIQGAPAPVMFAMQHTAVSLASSFAERKAQLAFPEGMPLGRESTDDDADH